MRHKRARFGAAVLVAVLAGASLGFGASAPARAATPPLAQLIGQKLMVAMAGTTPSSALLTRVRLGQVGGVILFGANIQSAGQLAALTAALRAAATAGGQPPLLIAADQEGGTIKRVPWAGPTLSAPQMGALGSSSTAFAQGRTTGTILECAGINTNLAPVTDVPVSTSSFMYQQGRTWSFSATTTATLSDAFASGLAAGLATPAMKHFPGIGLATANTDDHVVTITASQAALGPGLTPYKAAIGHGIPMVMLSNAVYPAYDATNAAGWSHAIGVDLLRSTLGFTGVSITDSLDGAAASRGVSAASLAVKAAAAGTDMLLLTGSEATSAAAYASLITAAGNSTIATSTLVSSYDRILALKRNLTAPPPDTTAPTLSAPVSRFLYPSALGAGSAVVPVRTAWSAFDGCGISLSTLQRQVNGGAWTADPLAAPSSTSTVESLAVGSTYRYRARATDGAGNVGAWRYGPAFRVYLRQQSSVVQFSGPWSTIAGTSYSGGSIASSTARGASASYTFTGQAIGWVAVRGPTGGLAAVYLDGTYRTTINLYAAAAAPLSIVYAFHWSGNGTHTIRIVNLGTAGHSRVDIDAFVRLFDL
jgi:beta-N-acetylhexosaminidase